MGVVLKFHGNSLSGGSPMMIFVVPFTLTLALTLTRLLVREERSSDGEKRGKGLGEKRLDLGGVEDRLKVGSSLRSRIFQL